MKEFATKFVPIIVIFSPTFNSLGTIDKIVGAGNPILKSKGRLVPLTVSIDSACEPTERDGNLIEKLVSPIALKVDKSAKVFPKIMPVILVKLYPEMVMNKSEREIIGVTDVILGIFKPLTVKGNATEFPAFADTKIGRLPMLLTTGTLMEIV